ncbi:MAG: response regulator [Sulfurospirillum sp.]
MLNRLKKLNILCVEDNAGVRKRLKNTLNFYFKEVIEANDGKEAYKIYKQSKPDAIITDIDMPNMNGVSLVKKIREKDSDIPLIILTAYSNEEYLLELINLKVNHFILKPINAQKLQTALEDVFTEEMDIIAISKDLSIDFNSMQILCKNNTIRITNREKLFLKLLYKNRKNVTTYQNIQDDVWQNDIMSQSALKTFIKVLRKKIPTEIIENISQVGYRFCNF